MNPSNLINISHAFQLEAGFSFLAANRLFRCTYIKIISPTLLHRHFPHYTRLLCCKRRLIIYIYIFISSVVDQVATRMPLILDCFDRRNSPDTWYEKLTLSLPVLQHLYVGAE